MPKMDMAIIDSLLAEEEGENPMPMEAAPVEESGDEEELGGDPESSPMALLDSMQAELDALRGMLG